MAPRQRSVRGLEPQNKTKYSLHTVRTILYRHVERNGDTYSSAGGAKFTPPEGGGVMRVVRSPQKLKTKQKEKFSSKYIFSYFFFYILSELDSTALVSVAKNPNEFPASTS